MNYFTKNKDKKIIKLSKTVEKRNNSDIKAVTVEHPKTAYQSLQINQIFTQEVETIEKPNIDRESVIIEHPRTVTKLSKPIKQPNIIPQKPKNKIKEYKESPWFLLPPF